MGSSRCRGGEHVPNGRAARACTGWAGRILEKFCGFLVPQLPDIVPDGPRSVVLCHTSLGHRVAAQESLLHTPHRRLAPSGVFLYSAFFPGRLFRRVFVCYLFRLGFFLFELAGALGHGGEQGRRARQAKERRRLVCEAHVSFELCEVGWLPLVLESSISTTSMISLPVFVVLFLKLPAASAS